MSDEKHTISTAEQAYQSLAFYLMDFIGIRKWQESRLFATVTPYSVTLCNHWLIFNNEKNEKALGWGGSKGCDKCCPLPPRQPPCHYWRPHLGVNLYTLPRW